MIQKKTFPLISKSWAYLKTEDPLSRVIFNMKVSPIVIGVAYSLSFRLLFFLAAWRAGLLRSVGITVGALDDIAFYTYFFSAAIVMGYYSWVPRGIMKVLNALFENGVIGNPIPHKEQILNSKEEAYKDFIKEVNNSISARWIPLFSILISLTATFGIMLPSYLVIGEHSYYTADKIGLGLALLFIFLALFAVICCLIFTLLGIIWFNKLFKSFMMNIRPLHPDRSGGLAPLGNFALNLSYLIAMIGLLFVISPLQRTFLTTRSVQYFLTTDLWIGLGAYTIFGPITFFAPLAVAHSAMAHAKSQAILLIASSFEKEYSEIKSILENNVTALSKKIKTLEEIQKFHDMTMKFPVWPFNTSNLVRFGTSFISPLFLALITELILRFIK